MILAAFALLLLTTPSPLFAQVHSFASPEELVSRLSHQGPNEPSTLAKELGVLSCGPPTESACSGCKTTIFRPRLDDVQLTAVIDLACWDSRHHYVLLLRRESAGRWQWLDTIQLKDQYLRMSFEFRTVVRAPVQELVVHNHGTVTGSGAFLGHLLVFKYVDGRLRLIFSSREWGFASSSWGRRGDYLEKTEFTFEPAEGQYPASITATSINENPSPAVLSRFKVVRTYTWQEDLHAFLPSFSDTIDPAPVARSETRK